MQPCCRSLQPNTARICHHIAPVSPIHSPHNAAWLAATVPRASAHKHCHKHCQPWQQNLQPASGRRSLTAASVGRRTLLGGLAPCCCGCSSCGHRSSWYDTYFAFNMAHGMEDYEAAVAPLKQALFQHLFASLGVPEAAGTASGIGTGYKPINILEVGIGTGPNFGYYPSSLLAGSAGAALTQQQQPPLTITGVEPNPAMWQYAQQSAEQAGLGQQQLQLVAADVQQMPFEQGTFDAAVITLVLCSLPNPKKALQEVLRVLKPGGSLLLIEHVIAPQLSWLQVQQRLLDPLQQLLADSCHLTRDTAALLQSSGFVAEVMQPQTVAGVAAAADQIASGSGSGLWRFEVEGMGLIGPHIAGSLKKPVGL